MNIVQLPFLHPTPQSEGNTAFPYGVIKGHLGNSLVCWLSGKMINCQFNKKNTGDLFNISMTNNWAESQGITYNQNIHLSNAVLLHCKIDVIEMIKTLIEGNTYVFLLSVNIKFSKTSYPIKDILFYGYNDVTQEFSVVAIDASCQLDLYKFPYTEFATYYQNCNQDILNFELRTIRTDFAAIPDLNNFEIEFTDYIESRNSKKPIDDGCVYGWSAQNALADHILSRVGQAFIEDNLYIRRFIEHKQLMEERIHGLYALGIGRDEICRLTSYVRQLAEMLNTPQYGDILSSDYAQEMASCIRAISLIEQHCYSVLLDDILHYNNNLKR